MQQPHNTRLAELSRSYLQEQQQPEVALDAVYACELQTELAELLQQLMQQDEQLDCLLELNAELPAVVLVAKLVLFHSVELLLKLTRQRTGAHQLHLRLMVACQSAIAAGVVGSAANPDRWSVAKAAGVASREF